MVPEHPTVEIKAMFGNLAAFVNGNMFMGLFGPAVGVRLDEEGRSMLLAERGAGPFGPEDRPMKEYVSLPPHWEGSPERAEQWIHRALEHTAAMPPKAEKR